MSGDGNSSRGHNYLEFCTTEEIFAELSKRHKSVLLVVEDNLAVCGHRLEINYWYNCSPYLVVGMCMWVSDSLRAREVADAISRDDDDDDDDG